MSKYGYPSACEACGKPINDNTLPAWYEKRAGQTTLAWHFDCRPITLIEGPPDDDGVEPIETEWTRVP